MSSSTTYTWKEKFNGLIETNQALSLLLYDSDRTTEAKMRLLDVIGNILSKVQPAPEGEAKVFYTKQLSTLMIVLDTLTSLHSEMMEKDRVIDHYTKENEMLLEAVKEKDRQLDFALDNLKI